LLGRADLRVAPRTDCPFWRVRSKDPLGRGWAAGGRETGGADENYCAVFSHVRLQVTCSCAYTLRVAKVRVAGSNPVVRSKSWSGRISGRYRYPRASPRMSDASIELGEWCVDGHDGLSAGGQPLPTGGHRGKRSEIAVASCSITCRMT